MRYLSVCSGIEAATVAWHPLGWTPVGFSEIEPFPSSVLAHHYPGTPNFGDMTKHEAWPLGPGSIDLLVGGTPCQSFSVAGLRKGLADPRGNLMLTYLAIVDRLRPRWIVWENVPGVLSSNGGRDFGTFLGALGELGYGWAYRVVDAQWCRSNGHPRAVPQRRRRVFVVGCFGDSRSAAAVLFERESVRRDPAKSRAPGQSTTAGTGSGAEGTEVATTLSARDYKGPSCGRDGVTGNPVVVGAPVNASHWEGGPHPTLNCPNGTPGYSNQEVFSQRGAMRVAAHTHAVATYSTPAIGVLREDEVFSTLTRNSGAGGETQNAAFVVAYPLQDGRELDKRQNGLGIGDANSPAYTVDCTGAQAVATTLDASYYKGQGMRAGQERTFVASTKPAYAVRRLTPRECERLQGFPNDYTAVLHKGKPAADGPRYKALGNSMAVNCMEWIGERIAALEKG